MPLSMLKGAQCQKSSGVGMGCGEVQEGAGFSTRDIYVDKKVEGKRKRSLGHSPKGSKGLGLQLVVVDVQQRRDPPRDIL